MVVYTFLGLYPLVGWKIGSEVTYIAEGNAAGTGTAVAWAGEIGEYIYISVYWCSLVLFTFSCHRLLSFNVHIYCIQILGLFRKDYVSETSSIATSVNGIVLKNIFIS